jgi:hypothetical protein
MTAQDVYNIANALPSEEYVHLYKMISENFNNSAKNNTGKKELITDFEAQQYLLSNIFSEKCVKKRLKTI